VSVTGLRRKPRASSSLSGLLDDGWLCYSGLDPTQSEHNDGSGSFDPFWLRDKYIKL